MSDKEFITFKEAGKLAGVSSMTIRRYAFKLLKSKKQGVRADVKVPLKPKRPYKISKERVMKKFGITDDKGSETRVNNSVITNDKDTLTNPLVGTLKTTITTLTDQLKAKDEQIKDLSERLRETHVLLLKAPPKMTPEPKMVEKDDTAEVIITKAPAEPEQPQPKEQGNVDQSEASTEKQIIKQKPEPTQSEQGINQQHQPTNNTVIEPKKAGWFKRNFG